MTHPRTDNNANAEDDWNDVGCDAETVHVNWHHETKQTGNEQHKAQLAIHLCHGEQCYPERQNGTEEVGEL